MNDHLQDCMSDLKTKDTKGFQETFCQRCRNRDCQHAQKAEDKFSRRVQTQPERMFHPMQILERIPRFAHLVEFTELREQAASIEISRQKKDWAAPELELPPANETLTEEVLIEAPETPIKTEQLKADPVPSARKIIGSDLAKLKAGNLPQPKGGIILEGASTSEKPKTPEIDPWAVPVPVTKTNPKFIAPGAKVRIGG